MTYQDYKNHLSKIADIGHSIAVLGWDKEVNLPKGSAQHRSQQIATLSGIAHELSTKAEFGNGLRKLNEDKSLSPKEQRNIQLSLKEFEKATKFDEAFVIERSKSVSETYHAWIQAREKNNWEIYAPALEKLIEIKKEESQRYEYGDHPYDSLLDLYEPTMTVKKLDVIFKDVKDKLLPLINTIKNKEQVNNDFLFQKYDVDKQWQYGLDILENMGYDFNRGRQDKSTHPFTTSFSPSDVRITTRVHESDFPMMLWSTIHEGGHALYEQGIPMNEYGLPSGSYISLGIHESQSRLWENNVARGHDYWTYHYPILQKTFPAQLGHISLKDFLRGMNKIESNLIRTEADELHYHFHVMIRYEIEKSIMEGSISVNDLKDKWNSMYKSYLGLEPTNDVEGILQDIHWSHGSFGYFPTYSLGSFYAAQFYQQASRDLGNLDENLQEGDSSKLLEWLRDNIHVHGHRYEAEELCKKITGKGLQLEPFMNYANEKFLNIYK